MARKPTPELSRLPPGRHGLPREFVARNQRLRLIEGVAEAVVERGFAAITIADIARHAAVSRRTFYEHFDSKEECFLAAFETALAELRERVGAAFASGLGDWPRGVREGIRATLRFLAAEPAPARCMVEALSVGPGAAERYDAVLESFAPYFRGGRESVPAEVLARLSPTTEQALAGGLVSLMARRVTAGEAERLESLLPDLVEFVLTPYLGGAEAAAFAREG